MSERASGETWTCKVVPRGGRLLDVAEIGRTVRGVGQQFSVRGVEAIVVGQVIERDDQVFVHLRRTGEVLRLAALTRKVQWDPQAGRDQPITEAERTAYERLRAQWRGQERSLRIVGPVAAPEHRGPPVLEVREFYWLRPGAAL